MTQYQLLRFPELASTNDYALRHLGSLPDRQVILAEKQTKGHGRFNRTWVSQAPDNIYMSLVLKPGIGPDRAAPLACLTHFMSLVICDALSLYGVTGLIKWPNDVQVQGAKLSGLLSECVMSPDTVKGCVLGAGINLNMTPDDFKGIDQPVTALNLVVGQPVDRDLFLDRLLAGFFNGYDRFLEDGFPAIRSRYIQHSVLLGKTVTVALSDSQVTGTACGFSPDGCLLLETRDGKKETIRAGDVAGCR